jgi:hypothetical protein
MRSFHNFIIDSISIVFGFLIFFGSSQNVLARPEYATKEKLNCFACHVSPWGGGPRNIMGKTYGSRGLGMGKLTTTDIFYGDIRFIGYLPTEPSAYSTVSGLAFMEAAVTGNVAVLQNEEDGSEMRALLTYNMATLSGSTVREAYIRWQTHASKDEIPIYFLFGRFYVPFGLLTDEHRTYTRIQTNMTYNNYDVGGAISGNFSNAFHYDLSLVNDFQTGGAFTNRDLTLGIVLNFRWNPSTLPFMLGASGNFQRVKNLPQPYASSLYGALSLDRLTSGKLSGSLLFERVDANNWNNSALNTGMINPSLGQFFIPSSDPAYLAFVQQTSSIGYYGQFKYNISTQWTLLYKFDYLALDRNYLDDAYVRHGIGFEAYLNSNLILNARYEKATGMRPEISASNVLAAQDDIFAMLRLWL